MTRNYYDYDFVGAVKPCGIGPYGVKPSGKCIKDAEHKCNWFEMCDLPEKNPPTPPTLPKKFTSRRKPY